jgi:hypothetical protein
MDVFRFSESTHLNRANAAGSLDGGIFLIRLLSKPNAGPFR